MASTRGILYPLQIENGALKVGQDLTLTRSHILSILETYHLERIMSPGYGIPQVIFTSVASAEVIAERIRIALRQQLPDVDFTVTAIANDDGSLAMTIVWAVYGVPQPPINYRLIN